MNDVLSVKVADAPNRASGAGIPLRLGELFPRVGFIVTEKRWPQEPRPRTAGAKPGQGA